MKITYLIALLTIVGLGIFFEYQIFFTEIGLNSRIGKAIQGAGLFVALFTAFIPLATTDPKKKKIKAKISFIADKTTKSEYFKNQMSDPLKDTYKDFPDPVVSCQGIEKGPFQSRKWPLLFYTFQEFSSEYASKALEDVFATIRRGRNGQGS